MNWFESIIYGFVSGLADLLPISSEAHQRLLLQLFGESNRDYVRDLIVHVAILLSVFSGCRVLIDQIRREQNAHRRNRRNIYGAGNQLEMRLLKNAAFPLVIGLIILSYFVKRQLDLIWVSILLVLNGLVLFIPERMMHGNKDERAMSIFDSWLLGISGAVSALTGISRTGAMLSVLSARGTSRQKGLNWALLLSIPALITLIGLDVVNIISGVSAIPFWSNFGGYLLSGIGAYLGGLSGISAIKLIAQRSGYSGFAFYSWGTALFTFILYLTVV